MAGFLGLFGAKPESVEAAIALLATAEERYKVLEADRDGLKAQLEALTKQSDKLRGQLGKAKAKAAAYEAEKPAKARAIGPLKEEIAADDLLELVKAAEFVEVVFSDGKREITKLAPRRIEGEAWRVGIAGLGLTLPELIVEGPGGRCEVMGYGLLIDGELVSYRPCLDVLILSAGGRYNVAGDLVFGAPTS